MEYSFLRESYIENPDKLIEKPDIDPKYIKEPALTEKGWNLWAKSLSDLTIQE